ncbi:F-box/WD repeat-containing protein [Populus alba x Populus x berolinensis]|uniref:F-box/WD repeat-containing protein n=1 Tax=Populus alba x Populus x berolinensis TaxID=444605 RepID=A0AAD6MIC4_9ROSI|nr:F-box/WD repeat-containing protein [Populus alba x Populus x berolinensis]
MLQLLFTVAFSAVPLTLYIPPVRSLNLFVETMEDLLRESRVRLEEDVLPVRSLSLSGLFLLSRN